MNSEALLAAACDEVLQHFPKASFRKGQREVILKIEEAFRQGFKFVVVEAPTGAGKSAIGVTLAGKYPCIYLTSQKILQNQYAADFPDRVVLVKGRGEYTCGVTDHPADTAPCVQFRQRARSPCDLTAEGGHGGCTACHYVETVEAAHLAQIALFNYHSFSYQRRFRPRSLMIADEAHGLENVGFGLVRIELEESRFPGLKFDRAATIEQVVAQFCPSPAGKDTDAVLPFDDCGLSEDEVGEADVDDFQTPGQGAIYEAVRRQHRAHIMRAQADRGADRHYQMRKALGTERLLGKLTDLWRSQQKGELQDNWVMGWEGKDQSKLVLKPIQVGSYLRERLLGRADRVLFMSATILNPGTFLRSVGIASDEAYFISMGSNFPRENRLVHAYPVAELSYKSGDADVPRLVQAVAAVLDRHAGQRGIIHAHAWRFVDLIRRELGPKYPRLMFQEPGGTSRDREDLLEQHQMSDDGVLVAPAMHEGLDLKDDLSRFQVLIKVPYPDLKDAQIAARMRIDPDWYGWITALKLIQSCGRSVRSETDFATTYVLDAGFRKFFARNYRNFPPWFTEALVWHSNAMDLLGTP